MIDEALKKRPPGRPQVRCDEDTCRIIAEAARRVFTANGYAAASMDGVARIAGVSKKTLYRLIPTKEHLFKMAIVDRIEQFVLSLDDDMLEQMAPEAALLQTTIEFGLLALSDEVVAIQKLVISERDRFPEIAADFYREAILATQRVLARSLGRLRRAGVIQIDNIEEGAEMLRGMLLFEPTRASMFGRRPLPKPSEITKRAARCVRLFLDGCRAKTPENAP